MVGITLILGFLPILAVVSALPTEQGSLLKPKTQSALNDCLKAAAVPAVFQSAAGFEELATPLNTRMQSSIGPAVITLPTTPQHISATVKCARQFGVKVTPRGGGHSYNAQCLGDGAIIVDLQSFHDVVYDPKTQLVRIGGGARLGNVAQKLYDQGKRAMPMGTCPDVGIGGHANGGAGWTNRLWGLTVDQTVEVEVVTADGKITKANKDFNKDLFWALRGASASFGIITNFYFKTYAASESNVVYSYWFKGLSVDESAAAFNEITNFGEKAPKQLGLLISLSSRKEGIHLYGAYYGKSQKEFDTLFAPLLKRLPSPDETDVSVKGWVDTLKYAAESESITVPEIGGTQQRRAFYAKSLMTEAAAPLRLETMKNLFNYLNTTGQNPAIATETPWDILILLSGGRESTSMNKDKLKENSFGRRTALWGFDMLSTIINLAEKSNKDAINLIAGLDKAVRRPMDGAYLNSHDPQLSRAEAHRLYYGPQYQKLTELKKMWDKDQVFWYPQSIDPKKYGLLD
ncbi:hypothetical protein H072_4300 [Dactylellina haptotyla CBS 200.50]|uniref:FAD-binding PCMH-type domain-containing protein n=1 Tax=Dactylellina haptotyla (strain CBS 200.50) TaxID=1284197 RepID=S8AL35_DACHA|nr:hypothetical protein H072_4300 [Dactylellina haptotyla CBS 200.50]